MLSRKTLRDKIKDINTDDNNIINGMWIGNSLSNLEKLSINSFLKNGHEYHLYLYNDVEGVPDGVVIKDADKILKYEKMKNRIFSYWFKCVLLYKEGGWWADLDVVCLKKFDVNRPYVFSTEGGRRGIISNCVVKSAKNSEVMKHCWSRFIDEVHDENSHKFLKNSYYELNNACHKFNLMDFSVMKEIFEPFDQYQILKSFREDKNDLESKPLIYSIHFVNSMISFLDMDKNATYNKDSLFEKLKERYL
jgi:hypothetical protein